MNMPSCMSADQSGEDEIASLLARFPDDPASLSALAGGGSVEQFEARFAASAGSHFALGVSSGTAALHVALLACDVARGDEVIVSSYGWGQTVAAVLAVGATPVFADIDPDTGTIDPAAAAALLTARTAAVLVTHIYGHPCDMEQLTELCAHSGIYLIADAAQAFGAAVNGKPIGAWGDITCFSLGRGKAVSTGEGGVVATNDMHLYQKMLLVSQHPLRSLREIEDLALREAITEICLNYRITPLAAAIGLVQLCAALGRPQKCQLGIATFHSCLKQDARWRLPQLPSGTRPSGYRVVLRFVDGGTSCDRDAAVARLQEAGVPASLGPIESPLYARAPFCKEQVAWFPRALSSISSHPSWRHGSCPHAERRTYFEDVAIEPDAGWHAITKEQVVSMAQTILRVLQPGEQLHE